LSCELAKGLLVVCLDNREAVRVIVREDRSEHDHVATLDIWAPVRSVTTHDLAFRVGESLGELWARGDEAEHKGEHAGTVRQQERVAILGHRCMMSRIREAGTPGIA
jgi:hypothetical protein